MINLLPPDVKQSFLYAQRNLKLLRWLIAFSVALAGLIFIATAGWVYINHESQEYASQVEKSRAVLKQEKLGTTQKQAQDITNSFKLVVQVLSRQVLFSKLLKQIASTIPPNAKLTDLNISQTQGAIDISAAATDYATATQVQVNLSDPTNTIFSKADIVNITCSSKPQDPAYPCDVTIRALFADNNPFLFINKGKNNE